ncbi:nucleoside deaminase [Pseudomonas entomophila]|uniref:nucleoside deaminase n=1 Tax=Pseudomonas entomophila TaxID=312306 RepID=UPI0023D89B06|nr:nucleoside deaminase [Pseudomonas entomophila]MDF0732560.1 nucleoside deaminase [Pseudomonas entomophila]
MDTVQSIQNAQQAVELVANQAIEASLQGTFAVGGCIVENATGKVLAAMHNNVLMPYPYSTAQPPFLPHDPTAHGERQLVDWYFANRERLALPTPDKLTVVTTLDPCAMCAGSLLTAGFNVAVSAIDTYAGINYNSQFDFPTLPPAVRQKAQASWGYYSVAAPINRPYQGARNGPVYAGCGIDAAAFSLTGSIFDASVSSVRDASNNSGLPPSELRNPNTLPADSKVRQALTKLSPWSLKVSCANPRMPGQELARPLTETARQADSLNAVALLDPFGNLLACLGGVEKQSPIRTAFMETTRGYAELRWKLMNDNDPQVRAQAQQHLTHPKYGTFVFLYAPDPNTSQAVMAFGAYGSTMEGPVPQSFPSNLQYVLLPPGTTAQAVAQLAQNLPPFYTQSVQVAPSQVLDSALISAAQREL